MSDVLIERARVASLSRSRHPDDGELIKARQNLTALSLQQHIKRVLAQAPPLTADQLDAIANLLRAGGAV